MPRNAFGVKVFPKLKNVLNEEVCGFVDNFFTLEDNATRISCFMGKAECQGNVTIRFGKKDAENCLISCKNTSIKII